MTTTRRNPLMLTAVCGLALASILVTRVLKAFTLAEIFAVAAFLCGLFLIWHVRRRQPEGKMPAPERLIMIGSVVGLAGLPVKLLFVLLLVSAIALLAVAVRQGPRT